MNPVRAMPIIRAHPLLPPEATVLIKIAWERTTPFKKKKKSGNPKRLASDAGPWQEPAALYLGRPIRPEAGEARDAMRTRTAWAGSKRCPGQPQDALPTGGRHWLVAPPPPGDPQLLPVGGFILFATSVEASEGRPGAPRARGREDPEVGQELFGGLGLGWFSLEPWGPPNSKQTALS